jgi:predicted nucleic acid-binding Zn ribbon protein
MAPYKEIDLNEEPCIFPACGHFYTITTLDGHLHLGEHYILDASGLPSALRAPDDSLDVDQTQIACPECRRSLRDIPRYGRVVRRSMLIQSTLKFITWSNNNYVISYGNFTKAQKALSDTMEQSTPAAINLQLIGSRDEQIRTIQNSLPQARYGEIVALRYAIRQFMNLVSRDEQPFQRVQELVRYARNQQQTESSFEFDQSVILQTRASALASALLLRCDLALLSDILAIRSSKALPVGFETALNFAENRQDCEVLCRVAFDGKHHLQQTEALIFWTQFAALELSWWSSHGEEERYVDISNTFIDSSRANHYNSVVDSMQELRAEAREHLNQARSICAKHTQARAVASEIDVVEKMLRESTFYSPVTNDEMRNVVSAMAREFRGTGHWYRCENGHPFTVGECGKPMQTARCPQCGGVIGGESHQAAAGVTHANDLEREFGGMRL